MKNLLSLFIALLLLISPNIVANATENNMHTTLIVWLKSKDDFKPLKAEKFDAVELF